MNISGNLKNPCKDLRGSWITLKTIIFTKRFERLRECNDFIPLNEIIITIISRILETTYFSFLLMATRYPRGVCQITCAIFAHQKCLFTKTNDDMS